MSQLPRYESYKDSGVQWLGEIPSHWGVMRLKNSIVSAQNGVWGDEPKSDENDLYCLRVADFDRRLLTMSTDNLTIRNISEKDYLVRRLAVGDLLLEKSGGGDKQPVGFVVQNNFTQKAVCSNFVAKVVLKHNMDSRYWTYHHQVLYNARVNTRSIKQSTGIQNLDATLYFNELACFPPIEEQILIALFLDKRLAQVDALISKQETLLEKLAEQRVALISHAVTKGLNPDVEMKETGISWFKQIPKSWDIKQLKFVITKIQTGSTPPSAVPEYYSSDDIVWYGPADFTDENYILNESVKKISALALEDKVVKPMPKGSIMMIGIGATLGKVAITNVDCTTNQQINSLISIEDVNAKYLMYQLNSLRDIVKLLSSASTLGIINQEKTKCLKIIVPSLNDQNEIVEFLDKELNEISAVKKSVEQTINKLKEYRSTLITQVVTGKIDVRNLKLN